MRLKKTNIIPFILLIFLFYGQFSSSVTGNELENMNLYTENSFLKLYMNEETAEIAVQDKKSGYTWRSNPDDSLQENIARGGTRDQLKAQLFIKYFQPGDKSNDRDSYNDSIKYEQHDIEKIDNGIKVTYLFGEKYDDRDFLPQLITEDRLEKQFLSKLNSSSDQNFIKDSLAEILLIEDDDLQRINYREIDVELDEIFGDYKFISRETLEEYEEIKKLEEEMENADEDEKGDIKNKISRKNANFQSERRKILRAFFDKYINSRKNADSPKDLTNIDFDFINEKTVYMIYDLAKYKEERLIELLEKVEYGIEEANFDRKENYLGLVKENIDIFKIPLEYSLDSENLIVRIPVNEIEYPEDVLNEEGRKVSFPLNKISILPNFGAEYTDRKGYMFVPDGSGGLIKFDEEPDSRTELGPYVKNVYGEDESLIRGTEKVNYPEQIYLPVFGIKGENKALFGIIEGGESIARIVADKSGRKFSFNRIYPEFRVIPQGEMELESGGGSINSYQSRIVQEDIKVRYKFLSENEADYMGMAKYYQNYLKDKYDWQRIKEKENLSLFLEIIGAVSVEEPVMGVPMNIVKSLTTFSQAKEILNLLNNKGITDINLIYSGMWENGLEHAYPDNPRWEDKLGNENELKDFNSYIKESGINLFPETGFLEVRDNSWFNNFSVYSDSARHINREIAYSYNYNSATYQREFSYNILSPSKLNNLMDNFLSKFKEYDISGITLNYLGKNINSDFRDDAAKMIDRSQASEIQKLQLQKISDNDVEQIVRGGNEYVLSSSKRIIDLSLNSTSYKIIDESIPFYQILLNGYFEFAGNPLNYSEDYDKQILKMVESGALPYFKWYYSDPAIVQETKFDYLFSGNYQIWMDKVLNLYERLNHKYAKIQNELIIDYRKLKEGVSKITYENGLSIYINYNKKDIEVENLKIPARDFVIVDS